MKPRLVPKIGIDLLVGLGYGLLKNFDSFIYLDILFIFLLG